MRKTLIPMLISLALCGAAAAAIIATTARAQSVRKPILAALVSPGLQLAANTPPPDAMPGREPHGPMAERRGDICRDLYARDVGRLAYTETKLELTPAQQPLFDRWKDVQLGIARQRENKCGHAHMMAEDSPSPVDRMARQEERLKARLANLDSERPALEALFAALSPRQKMALNFGDRPPMEHMFAERMGRGFGDRHPGAPGEPPMPGTPPGSMPDGPPPL